MSRFKQVVIDTEEPIESVVDTLVRVLGVEVLERDARPAVLAADDTSAVLKGDADLDNSLGMPLSEFGYVLDLWTRPDPRLDGYARQEAAARQVYEQLVAGTPWRLLLAFDDLQQEVARRDAAAAA